MDYTRTQFLTATRGALNRQHAALRLWERAKKLGVWNPADLDFSQDTADWNRLSDPEQDAILQLAALFEAGEEAVTLDLLPLLQTVAREGRLEDEIYLTSFLWEEAKHVDFFARFFEAIGVTRDLHEYHGENYRRIFYEALPNALHRLEEEPSPVNQAVASVTYNMIVEGVLAETGYHAWHAALERNNLMPGTIAGLVHIKRDESRHIAFGIYFLSRLVAEHGDPVWNAIEQTMGTLLPVALGVVHEIFDRHESRYGAMPFGLSRDEFQEYATRQFQKRFMRLMHARTKSLEEIVYGEDATEDA
ncbi:ribonucleoside-diphosphate reductase beta chain [Ardenticatena maritima]|uniref:R2-like ligand binding oxidase n=1 Tax=Ardenticatena maritima TaxID=872965 RepID=A0A0M8K9M4_9CHLR|nr:R2-like ligand-binding oxidase [Ardenticatena maritima]KPL89105.1 ribonucleotide-diphosphate reductase [Ardenticatena maritima]GAP63116.1 ribonucleoside-diphosphate reductase beta chain [Ardenticatena maritima]